MKLSEAIQEFLNVHRLLWAEATAIGYEATLAEFQEHITLHFGDLDLVDVKREHLRSFRDYLLTRPRKQPGRRYLPTLETGDAKRRHEKNLLSRRSVHGYIRYVQRFFNFSIEEGYLLPQQSPLLGFRNVTLPDMAAKEVSTEHILALIKLAQQKPILYRIKLRDAAITSLIGAESTDGRIVGSGHLARLDMNDIDGDYLHLQHKAFFKEDSDGEFTIRMTPVQKEAVQAWLDQRPPCDSTAVFTTQDDRSGLGQGERMRQRAIYSAYWKDKNMTPKARQTHDRQIAHDLKFAARRLALVLFLLDTGARLGGIVGLTRDRLDLANLRAVVIEKHRGGGKARTVFFVKETRDALETWLRLSEDDDLSTVFGSTGYRLRGLLNRMAEQAGIEGIHNPHSWRHAFAKHSLLNGANLSIVSQMMGHSGIAITNAFYARWNVREQAEAHAKASPIRGLLRIDEEE